MSFHTYFTIRSVGGRKSESLNAFRRWMRIEGLVIEAETYSGGSEISIYLHQNAKLVKSEMRLS